MISLGDVSKLLAPIKRKIFLLIGRAVLTAINDINQTQLLQVTGLKGEVLSQVERFEDYGFYSYPDPGAEALLLFPNGNRDQAIVIKVHDKKYRPDGFLQPGELIICPKWNTGTEPHYIHFNALRKIYIYAKDSLINMEEGHTTSAKENSINGRNVYINAVTKILCSAPYLENSSGDIKDNSPTTPSMQDMRDKYNAHTHGGAVGPPAAGEQM